LIDSNLLTQFPFEDLLPIPISMQVWEARPHNIHPTCLLDKILLDLVHSGSTVNTIGPPNTPEFSSPKFPSVAALLNPQHHVTSYPMASSIAAVSGDLASHYSR
jgi:hypothetical protein